MDGLFQKLPKFIIKFRLHLKFKCFSSGAELGWAGPGITCSKICICCFLISSDRPPPPTPARPDNNNHLSFFYRYSRYQKPGFVQSGIKACYVLMSDISEMLYWNILPASRESFSFLMELVAWASMALMLLMALTWIQRGELLMEILWPGAEHPANW